MMRPEDILTDVIVFKFHLENSTDLIIGGGQKEQGSTKNIEEGTLYIVKDADLKAYIPGSSIAGVLLRKFQKNQNKIKVEDPTFQYFWGIDTEHSQSHINIGPAILKRGMGEQDPDTKIAVKINNQTGVGEKGALFNYVRLLAGAQFELTIEVKVRSSFNRKKMTALADFVKVCFDQGLSVGAKSNKNYGCLSVLNVEEAHFKSKADFTQWIAYRESENLPKSLPLLPDFTIPYVAGNKCTFKCKATLSGGILTAVKLKDSQNNIDSVQMNRTYKGKPNTFWLDAESILGPIRHRSLRILLTMDDHPNKNNAIERFRSLFGDILSDESIAIKSRIVVTSSIIQNVKPHKQTNVAIDRFTGGAMNSMLTSSTMVYKNIDSADHLNFSITINDPEEYDIALILFVLRDMATKDLPLGGKKSIGRGTIESLNCVLTLIDKMPDSEEGGENEISIKISKDGKIESEHLALLAEYKLAI